MADTSFHTLSGFSEELERLSASASERVVFLDSRGGFPTSGTIWEPGFVVVADHVLHRESGLRVTFADGSERDAELAGRDPSRDLALLKVETPTGGFEAMAAAEALRPGMLAIAVSRNSERTANSSLAVINAIGGEWRSPFGGLIDRHLRLDVRLHAGFSGGALVDTKGALVGINSSRLSRRSPIAVPVSTVERIVAELKERGHVRQGYLGIASFPIVIDRALREGLRLETDTGLIVVQIEEGSGAEAGGMLQGDLLLTLQGRPIRDPEELQDALEADMIGEKIGAQVIRGGAIVELELTVGDRPVTRPTAPMPAPLSPVPAHRRHPHSPGDR